MDLGSFQRIVVLTGAGISAESGIRTFRDQNGLWENHAIEDVASPEGFLRNPALVHRFYNARRAQLKDPMLKPNAAHLALARLENDFHGDFLLVTQNVDNLHKRAGSRNFLQMHGRLDSCFCEVCAAQWDWTEDLSTSHLCQRCKSSGSLRPDIVWFGEMPRSMEEILTALHACDLFISIGTSGHVYPAAGFAQMAQRAYKIEVNLSDTEISSAFQERRLGTATEQVPKLVEDILKT